jgi:hypothetical protein
MKTRYQLIQDAGDHVDSALKLIRLVNEPELAKAAGQLLDALAEASEREWDERNAEPELECA